MKKAVLFGVLVVAIVLGAASMAYADTLTYGPAVSPLSNATPVVVKASVAAKIQMSITTTGAASQTIDFGTLDPGATAATQTVVIVVKSNKNWTIDKAIGTPATLTSLGMSTKYAAGANILGAATVPAAAGTTVTDEFAILAPGVPWTTAPAAYTTNVTYTVTAP